MKEIEIVRVQLNNENSSWINKRFISTVVYAVLFGISQLFEASTTIFILLIGITLGAYFLTRWLKQDILVINFEENLIQEGSSISGIRYLSSSTYFSSIEKIFINRISTFSDGISYDENYTAYLKTTEGDKFWIVSGVDKYVIINKLIAINEKLKTEIYDNTRSEPARIQ